MPRSFRNWLASTSFRIRKSTCLMISIGNPAYGAMLNTTVESLSLPADMTVCTVSYGISACSTTTERSSQDRFSTVRARNGERRLLAPGTTTMELFPSSETITVAKPVEMPPMSSTSPVEIPLSRKARNTDFPSSSSPTQPMNVVGTPDCADATA